ncbi:MAG: 5'/3'-nucleotidase SurE [Anaerolineales bacterium]|nr:5'/3'-nucleotidase SurE [Anaerolineales bacterium]
MTRPSILLTNDDGIDARGLWIAAEALSAVGEVTVAAPNRQWSGAGRSLPRHTSGRIVTVEKTFGGAVRKAFAVDGSPAQTVLFGLLEILPTPPALVVSGINLGENVGYGVTMSGTVGAALEAAAAGLPAIAISQATPSGLAMDDDRDADFSATGYFAALFARKLIAAGLREEALVLKIDVPIRATPETPWALTRLSRARYYQPMRPKRKSFSEAADIPYRIHFNPQIEAADTDVYALHNRRIVSVTPLGLDLTARVDFPALESALRNSDDPPGA